MDALIHYTSYRFGLTWAAASMLIGSLCGEILRGGRLAGLDGTSLKEVEELAAVTQAARPADERPASVPSVMAGLLDAEGMSVLHAFYQSDLSLREAGSLTRSVLDHLRSKGSVDLGTIVERTPVVALLLRRVGVEESFTPVMGLPAVRGR